MCLDPLWFNMALWPYFLPLKDIVFQICKIISKMHF